MNLPRRECFINNYMFKLEQSSFTFSSSKAICENTFFISNFYMFQPKRTTKARQEQLELYSPLSLEQMFCHSQFHKFKCISLQPT